jgi:hypothetical protein
MFIMPIFNRRQLALTAVSVLVARTAYAEAVDQARQTSEHFWPGWAVVATVGAATLAAIASVLNAIYANYQQRKLAKIQGEIQLSVQQSLQTFQQDFEWSRQRDIYLNEQVTLHLAQLHEVAAEIHALAGLVGFRYWLSRGDWLETERLFRAANAKLQLHMRALITLGVVSETLLRRWTVEIKTSVLVEWMEVIGLVVLRDPEYRKQFPNFPPFDESLYFNRWQKLQNATSSLTELVADLTADIIKTRTKVSDTAVAIRK